ncbi:isocitrate lyase/PEP mutase family protein [Luteimonas deserti]|uniref:Isocitrate lyase/phosphoenolpyruvate mutase family protein n=1 Tax=Luteimonas deserti TaxID=2752306 RepID=A0A7Z0TWC2_9GAMM|nr:isocitrate lyase/phosphoenolpyruvate mutase family protein [Luteimonas deserti]NYZ63184.1 isocitrate lyase/phosphoenolpyruvate mutase family protein [Luteimonas deserti]
MHSRAELARRLHALHHGPAPLLLFNAWDAGSAKTIASCGADALATSSWAVAAAHGMDDGEQLPLGVSLDVIARIAAVSDLPLTVDLERGYGDPAATVTRAIDAGAVGCNLEDGLASGLRPTSEQAGLIGQARAAADAADLPFFINARTDQFLQQPADTHNADMIEAVVARAQAYAAAGADGLFVPGLVQPALIEMLVERSPLPVNIMVMPGCPPLAELARLGVARVSHGPGPYLGAMRALSAAFEQACAAGSE